MSAFADEVRRRTAEEKARAMRYRRPMLADLGWCAIEDGLCEIEEACAEVHWYTDTDEDTLVNALDGDEDEAWEFKMTFADVEAKCEDLRHAINELDPGEDYMEDFFNTCTVALIGNRYKLLGWDGMEEDYFGLTGYEPELAVTEAGKRLMRMTKAEMISAIGQCMGIVLAYADLKTQYDSLSAALAVLRDENTSILKTVREIEEAYERNGEDFDRLLACLPERVWIE